MGNLSQAKSILTMEKIVQGTVQNSTSGTSIDFTGIPSWAKKITVMFSGVSTSGTSAMLVQIGTSGGVVTTGYTGSSTGGGGAVATLDNSSGFCITYINVATTIYHGKIDIINISSNTWIESGVLGGSSTGVMNTSGGSKTLSGTLDRIRITTANGTDTFDAGQINIMYEG